MNLQNISNFILFLNHLQEMNTSLDKKKILLMNQLKNTKARITNYMLVTNLYNDLDFKSHFRLNMNSVEVNISFLILKIFVHWIDKKITSN